MLCLFSISVRVLAMFSITGAMLSLSPRCVTPVGINPFAVYRLAHLYL